MSSSQLIRYKLQWPSRAPPTFTVTPTSIIQDCHRLVEHSRQVQNQVVENVASGAAATFNNVILPLAHEENARVLDTRAITFYESVSTDAELRDTSRQAKRLLEEFAVETAMRSDIFHLVKSVLDKNEPVDQESRHVLEKMYRDHVRNGASLPIGPQRDRFKEIKRRLNQVVAEFRKNLVDSQGNDDAWYTPQELDGLPNGMLGRLRKGVGENEGKLLARSGAVRTFAKNVEIRKRAELASTSGCNQNIPLFKEAMVLRDEAARLLGYPNHATFRMEDKMARTPENVEAFLANLQSLLTISSQTELEQLKQAKRLHLESCGELFDGHFFLWDLHFYRFKLSAKGTTVNPYNSAEYFSLQPTLRGMFDLFQELFGVQLVEIVEEERDKIAPSGDGADIVWHEDVQVFAAWDLDELDTGHLGYLYLDMYSREGKYRGPSAFSIIPGFLNEDGIRQCPAAALIWSFDKPTANKPCLLPHYEVVSLFHELGHGIHDLVSKTRFARFHGPDGTVVDFGEAPSQMLENWCWLPEQMKRLSKHYSYLSPELHELWSEKANGKPQPVAQMPDEMIEAIIRDRHDTGALEYLRQIILSAFDMIVHQPESNEAIKNMNIPAVFNDVRRKVYPIEGPSDQSDEWGHYYTQAGQIMGEYDAGLYSYFFSNMYAADMFHTFFRANPINADEGRRYRYAILEKGGGQDELKTMTDYLGRDVNTDGFYKQLGLT